MQARMTAALLEPGTCLQYIAYNRDPSAASGKGGRRRLMAAVPLDGYPFSCSILVSTAPQTLQHYVANQSLYAKYNPSRGIEIPNLMGEALETPSPADLAVMFDLRKSEDEADDMDQDLGEKTKSKSQRSGTGDFTEVKSDAREGQRYLRPAAQKNGQRESQVDDENAHDGAAMRQGAARRSSRVTKNRLGNGTVNLEGQECQRIRRADRLKADPKRTIGIKAMNEFMPIFNISKFSNPRELKKILKGDLELQYEWHRLRELRRWRDNCFCCLSDTEDP
ncbi:hypothetical protein B0H11DRAFT_1911875 [Mycena galericulata]|nr:hypothetical protein B0H11DRAFT_1911875 [Mycena galericulata]